MWIPANPGVRGRPHGAVRRQRGEVDEREDAREAGKRAKKDASFNKLTGLPSPEALRRHLLSPEDVVGVEHLLCGRGIAKATVSMKANQVKALMDGQKRGLGPEELAEQLKTYSDISTKLAMCRASYAAMF